MSEQNETKTIRARDIVVNISVNEVEYALIKSAAKLYGENQLSDFIRKRLMSTVEWITNTTANFI